MRSVSAAIRTVTGTWCRECGKPRNGPTSELLAWAKKVGRQEVITELRDKGVAIPREMTACQP